MEGNRLPLSPYAWAEEFAQAEAPGAPVDDSWVTVGLGDEKAFLRASVGYAFYPADRAIEEATKALGGMEGVAEVENMLSEARDVNVQRAILQRMSPEGRAAIMELAARSIQAQYEGQES
jgi:hypothetical protein